MRRLQFVAVAAASFVLCSAASPSVSPKTAAAQADVFLKARHSPLAGLGHLAVRLGDHCVRPYDGRFLLAITGGETAFAKIWGRFQPASHNAWSWGDAHFSSYAEGLRVVARGVCSDYIVARHLVTIPAFEARYVGYPSSDWLAAVSYGFKAMGGKSILLPARNAPTKQPPPLPPVKAHGRRVNTSCDSRTLVVNERGRCVRDLQWLLTGQDPAIRPSARAHGANRDGHYWRIRPGHVTGVYGKATVKQVQVIKYRLGYPAQQANGAAGPKLRKYLLGQATLPKGYRAAEGKRYKAWKASSDKGSKLRTLLRNAAYLLSQNDRISYTQDMSGCPHSRLALLLCHPRGPPLPAGQLWGDCSGTVEALYIWSGLPDPAGEGAWQHYPGVAVYTGTQAQHGKLVWRSGQSLALLRPGDLIFYGSPPGFHHVTMYLGNGRVFSNGQSECPCNNSVLYRDDAYEARRYVG